MDKIIIFCLISIVWANSHAPQVHETPVEHHNVEQHNTRTIRNPNDHVPPVKYHQPPVFNFQTATQQDPQRTRYALQQKVDFANITKRKPRVAELPTSQEIAKEDWVPMDPTVNKMTDMELMKEDKDIKGRTNKKLRPNSYYDNDSTVHYPKSSISRQDQIPSAGQSQYIYIKPNILKNNFGIDGKDAQKILQNAAPETPKPDRNYAILSDLIGKNPNVQLEGLKKLLEAPIQNNIFPVVHGPQPFKTPIAVAVPQQQHQQIDALQNTNSKPILEALQAQLDATSKEQANNVLAQAHQQALAHVEAQHHAIAFAAEKAKNEALAKIAAQNQNVGYGKPQALALQGQVPVHVPISAKLQVPQPHVILTSSPQPYLAQAAHDSYSSTPQPPPRLVYVTSTPGYVASTQRPFVVSTPVPVKLEVEDNHIGKPLQVQSYAKHVVQPTRMYAPNHHHHQIIALLQAERVVAERVKNQNKAILQAHAQKEQARVQQEQLRAQHEQVRAQQEQVRAQHEQAQAQQEQAYAVHHEQLQDQDQDNEKTVEVQVHQTVPQVVLPHATHQEVVLGHDGDNQIYRTHHDDDEENELQYAAKYAFGYRIKDNKMGNDFGHEEKRDGKTAKGQYHVLLPDGRVQNVEYYADDSGYHAKISYQNIAHH